MKTNLLAAPLLGVLLAWPMANQAAVNVDRTRVIMGANQKSVSVVLTNESGGKPYLAQSWIEDQDGKTSDDLLALPPLQRLDPGKKAQVRITQMNRAALDRLPQDRESLFYFVVREIPPEPEDKNASLLQLTTQSQLKLFLRPAGLTKDGEDVAPERSLQAQAAGGTLTLKNPTPYHVTVIWLGLDRKQPLHGFDSPTMLAPFSERALKVDLPAGLRELMLGNVDDYGGLRMNRYRCEAGLCVFEERVKD
ncbi:fimbria/pilus periplasmic chaperone [Achromobacter insuavis]|nr:fimbria/pilus periplasmic chaperone [Achromobacter insuavis]